MEEERREKEKIGGKFKYQHDLEKQIEEQIERQQVAYEEFLKEKLMVDEIVRKIYDEDERCD